MFVGWIRKDEFEHFKHCNEKKLIVDEALFEKQLDNFPHLCFKCKNGDDIVGLGAASLLENSAKITHCESQNQNAKEQLLTILLENLQGSQTVYALIAKDDVSLFERFDFVLLKRFYKLEYRGTQVAFHFSQAHAKEVNREDFHVIAHKIDTLVMRSDRSESLKTEFDFQSSLQLATGYGFLHSRAVGNKILISPWTMANEAYMDAEKLLRGVLYYRGLKKIVAFAPDVSEIVSLYNSYKFEKQSEYCLVYKGLKPLWLLENMYAF